MQTDTDKTQRLFSHPPDPANASAAGPAAMAAGPSPGEGAKASNADGQSNNAKQNTRAQTSTDTWMNQTQDEQTHGAERKQK